MGRSHELSNYYPDKIDMFEKISIYAKSICEKEHIEFNEIKMTTVEAGQTLKRDFENIGEVEILKPKISGKYSENKNSMVSFLNINGNRLCFPGDIEAKEEAELVKMLKDEDYKCVFMISPHHGSKTSSSKIFIKTLNPDLILIQSRKGEYAHPSEETITNYNRWNKFFIKQEYAGEVNLTVESRDVYIQLSKFKEILEGEVVPRVNIIEFCDRQLSEIIKSQLKRFKGTNMYEAFNEASNESKIVLIDNFNDKEKFRDLMYLKESAGTLISKGINIQDTTLLSIFFRNGEIQKFTNFEDIVEIIADSYSEDSPIKK